MRQGEIEDFARKIIQDVDLSIDEQVAKITYEWVEGQADAYQEGVVAGQMSAWNNSSY